MRNQRRFRPHDEIVDRRYLNAQRRARRDADEVRLASGAPPARVLLPPGPDAPEASAPPLEIEDHARDVLVTSFTTDLYEATGCRLLSDWQRWRSPRQRLIVANEGAVLHDEHLQDERIEVLDLLDDPVLQERLLAWRSIISVDLGGWRPRCGCPPREVGGQRSLREGDHKEGCADTGWNRRFHLWFRKVAAMRIALEALEADAPDTVTWLDCDVRLTGHLQPSAILGSADLVYARGQRPSVEAGYVSGTYHASCWFWGALLGRYLTDAFRADRRWDDGFQMVPVIDQLSGTMRIVDIAAETPGVAVLACSALSPYLVHDKGVHVRSGVVQL